MSPDVEYMCSFVAQYNKRKTASGKKRLKKFAYICLTEIEYTMFLYEIENP